MRLHATRAWVLFLDHGYLAVSFFFILSGFVLTWNYGDRWEQQGYGRFLTARFARIYPVYLLALLLQIPFYVRHFHPGQTIAVLLMVQSWTTLPSSLPAAWNYPAWTLSVEWFFYICFPLLLAAVLRVRSRKLALVCIAVLTIAIAGPQAGIGGRLSWFTGHIPLPLLRLPEFLLGMLLARSVPSSKQVSKKAADYYVTALLILTAGLLTLNLHRFVLLVVCTFSAILWLLAYREGRIKRWLEWPPLVLLGGASYAIYILQDPVRNWISLWNQRYIGWASIDSVIYPCILILLSIVVFLWFEQPLRQRIRSSKRSQTVRV